MTYKSARSYKPKPAFSVKYDQDSTAVVRNPQSPPTEKQMDYLTSLAQQRDIGMTAEEFTMMIAALKQADACTKGWVSARIEEYKACPKRSVAVKSAEPGYYTLDGDFYVVVENKAKTHTYAKKLVSEGRTHKWDYAPGMGRKMASLTPLTMDEAAKFGHLHGKCLICLRPLVDPESVKAGIGPVCAKKVRS